MQVNKKMDIHLEMGKPQQLQFLLDLDTTITSNPQKIQHFISQSEFNGQVGNDAILMFHFYIQEGKQQQALDYFKQALECDKEQRDHLSPLQKPLKNPNSQGNIQYQYKDGKIIVKYRFYGDKAYIFEDSIHWQEQFTKFEKFSIDSKLILKGNMKHNAKNRTNVKVDYVNYNLFSDQISPSDYKIIASSIGLGQEGMGFFNYVPIYHMLGNLKSANFQIKLASFRQLKSYFNKASGDKYNKQQKPFPYVNKGIFRKQANCYFFYKDQLALKAQANYNGQDVFIRLIKIYTGIGMTLLN